MKNTKNCRMWCKMPEMKNWLFEFIQPDDIVEGEVGEFVTIPKIDEDAEYESITVTVLYKGERRKININKGNGKSLAASFGTNTDLWQHKKFTLHVPDIPAEKATRMKYFIIPYQLVDVSQPGKLTTTQTIEALRANGVSDEQIKIMLEIGAIK